jgi:hypothetical protein
MKWFNVVDLQSMTSIATGHAGWLVQKMLLLYT